MCRFWMFHHLAEGHTMKSISEEESVGAEPPQIPNRELRKLYKTMSRMNFSNLVRLSTSAGPSERVSLALELLRQRLG